MEVRLRDRLGIFPRVLAAALKVPGKWKILFLLVPVQATRFLEFSYLWKYLEENPGDGRDALDISSPVMMAYLLEGKGFSVLKTDINQEEERFVRTSPGLRFRREDARELSFPDDSFDLVYSISVIEHIHGQYVKAVEEMARVTRPGGTLYLTFPVASPRREEWMGEEAYPHQKREGDNVFFQYRFGPEELKGILDALTRSGTRVVREDIYWERRDGLYDRMVEQLRREWKCAGLNLMKSAVLNLMYGPRFFESRPAGFSRTGSFGNAHLICRKEWASGK